MEHPWRTTSTIEKIIVDGKLVPVNPDDNLNEEAEGETPGPQPDASFKELMNNVA